MTYQIISERYEFTSKNIAFRISQHKVATSCAVVLCEDKETGERYKDKMYFVEIPTLDKLMEIINNMDDFTFTITPGMKEPMDEWGFTLTMGDREEYFYRYPILWVN